jgi:hypothetical protein
MDLATFEDYVRRFNAQDPTAFDRYIAPEIRVLNGTLLVDGREAMRGLYMQIWSTFTETIIFDRFICSNEDIAVRMKAHFATIKDNTASPLGPVRAGETFDFSGVVLYRVENEKFSEITIAYNSFVHTDLDKNAVNRGVLTPPPKGAGSNSR